MAYFMGYVVGRAERSNPDIPSGPLGERMNGIAIRGFVLAVLLGISQPAVAAPPKEKIEPEWMTAFRQVYQLNDGEYVKRVAKSEDPVRVNYYLNTWYKTPAATPADEDERREYFKKNGKWLTLFVDQDGTTLTQRHCLSSVYLSIYPEKQRGDNLLDVAQAVKSITGLSGPEFRIDSKYKDDPLFAPENLTVHGDFVVRRNAPLDKLAPQLEAILRDQCKVDVGLRVVEEMQEVFVVSGKFELKPPPWQTKKMLDIYAMDEGVNKDFDYFDHKKRQAYIGRVSSIQYGGLPIDFIRFLGSRLNTRMLWEGEVPYEPKFSWNSHTIGVNPTEQEKADDKDPEKVLKHATEQTGLTFKKEKRKVPVLVLSPGKK
jgi:hypothetical protein